MDTQDLQEELSKIMDLSSTRFDTTVTEQNTLSNASGMDLKKAQSHMSLKALLDPVSSLESATGDPVQLGKSYTALNAASHASIKTDPSAMVSAQNKDIEKSKSITLNIAANEFFPAKDVHDVSNLPNFPPSSRPLSPFGHTEDEQSVASVMHAFEDQLNGQIEGTDKNEQKSHFPSKIPRLNNNAFYFPKKESEMSIREHREFHNQQNFDIPIDKSEIGFAEFLERLSHSNANNSNFPGHEKEVSISELRKIHDQKVSDVPFDQSQIDLAKFLERQQPKTGEETVALPNVPQKEEDVVEIDPLIETDMSIKEFLIHRLKSAEVKNADQNINWVPYGIEELPTKQSSSSLHPQTSLTESTAESREAIVDDDGFERDFPKVPSGNLSSVESTVWMDTNASFVIEEPTVSNYHVKLSTGLREPFPRTSQNMDDDSSIDTPAMSQTDVTPQPETTKKKSKKSLIRRISSYFHKRSSQKD